MNSAEPEQESERETVDSRYFQIRKKLTSRPPLVYNPFRVTSLTSDPGPELYLLLLLLWWCGLTVPGEVRSECEEEVREMAVLTVASTGSSWE